MKTIWKLFVGDIRRITSNVVSIIIVIGLVVIPRHLHMVQRGRQLGPVRQYRQSEIRRSQ